MASTQLGKNLAKEITKDVSRLLGRGKKAFQCPLTPHELADMWNAMIRPDIVAAWKLLDVANIQGIEFSTTASIEFDTFAPVHRYTVRLRHTRGEPRFIRVPFTHNEAIHLRSENQLKMAVPPAKYIDFMQWMDNCAIVQRDFAPVVGTLEDVLSFCGTIGQLVRAVPDLYKYLDHDRQYLLRQQSRPSNMPYEWGAFDRGRIDAMQLAMAKANLMPAQDQLWENIDGTGVVYAGDINDLTN